MQMNRVRFLSFRILSFAFPDETIRLLLLLPVFVELILDLFTGSL